MCSWLLYPIWDLPLSSLEGFPPSVRRCGILYPVAGRPDMPSRDGPQCMSKYQNVNEMVLLCVIWKYLSFDKGKEEEKRGELSVTSLYELLLFVFMQINPADDSLWRPLLFYIVACGRKIDNSWKWCRERGGRPNLVSLLTSRIVTRACVVTKSVVNNWYPTTTNLF